MISRHNSSCSRRAANTRMEVAQEWPEPIVRVQSLAEAEAVPERYVKPPSERPSFLALPTAATAMSAPPSERPSFLALPTAATAMSAPPPSLPVINLSWLNSPDAALRQATEHALSEACREWGFFQAVNHGVAAEVLAGATRAWREFFGLPMEAKQAYANSPKNFEGYGSRLGVTKGACLDWGDYYFLQVFPRHVRNYRMWPALPPSLRERTEAYGEEIIRLCEDIMTALSVGLGLEEGFLRRAFGESAASLRVNYYPRCPQPELTLGVSPHSDPGGFTVLLTDHVKGLQIRKDGAWISIDPLPGALIINMGDQIQMLTNAAYKSVEHRVVVNAATERLSLAFFYNPQDDVPIEPAKELLTPGTPAMYKPTTFKEYKLYMRLLGPHGKSHVDFVKASS